MVVWSKSVLLPNLIDLSSPLLINVIGLLPESPILIEASPEDISIPDVSSSNVVVAISTPSSNFICPELPMKETLGLAAELTYPRKIPVLSNAWVVWPILKKGLVPLPLAFHCLLVPNDIEASVDETSNALELILISVTLIATSEPVILNEPPLNVTLPSLSPNLKLPAPSMNTPLPAVNDKFLASGPTLNDGVPLPSIIILPSVAVLSWPKLILDSAVEIWIVDDDISKFSDARLKLPPSNFTKLEVLPTWNSGSPSLLANQKPAVVDVADVLPVAIYPCVDEPTTSISLLEVLPTLILLLSPSSIMLPSPILIDACVDEISILFASNSNEPTWTVKSVPSNWILSPLPLPINILPLPST